jgi:hypothetical protein
MQNNRYPTSRFATNAGEKGTAMHERNADRCDAFIETTDAAGRSGERISPKSVLQDIAP